MQRKKKRITSRRWCRGSEETNGGDLTSALSMSQLGHKRPTHSAPVPINVRCYSKATEFCGAAK